MSLQTEQLRHQYLEAMGVSSWLSCSSLPGAAESPAWVNDFQYPAPEIPFQSDRAQNARAQLGLSETQPPAKPVDPLTQQQGMQQARAALGLMSETVEQETSVSANVQVESTVAELDESSSLSEESQQIETPPNFKLAFQRVGQVLVVDSLPTQGGNFSSNYLKLAVAICDSLGDVSHKGDEGLSAAFMLPWPMFASKTLDQSYPQAAIAVQHKLAKELQRFDIKVVLLFGEAASQMVLERKEPLDELKGIVFSLRSDVQALATHSLTEAMQLPGVKKQIWHDLQPMILKLSGH